MATIDTSSWKEFKIGDIFEKLDLGFVPNRKFNKATDISLEKTEEFDLPLVNAKHNNNGIMYYGRSSEWEFTEMSIDIVSDGAASTGDVYPQPQKTGVLYNAYLVKPLYKETSFQILAFLSTVIEKSIKSHFGYENKCIWDKVKECTILLPITEELEPDYEYMENYMKEVEVLISDTLTRLQEVSVNKHPLDIKEWKLFKVSDLFKSAERGSVKSLQLLPEGKVPVIAASGNNQGIVGYFDVEEKYKNALTISCNGVGCGSCFYHNYGFNINGDAIVLQEKEKLSHSVKMFIASIINTSFTKKYSYAEKCSADKALAEEICLPVTRDGAPDFEYMAEYIEKSMGVEHTLMTLISAIC